MKNLQPFTSEKTTLIVTHRVSSIRDADHIYVLEEGQSKNPATTAPFLPGEIYAELFQRQMIEKELEKTRT
jgi:ATP-binding cassette subfamily B protein